MAIFQDTIHFDLTAEKTVINDTVKIAADITAIVQPGQSATELTAEIRETMKKFIDADWQFGNTERTMEAGLERVTLVASARVPETENHNLYQRAKNVARPGLEISDIHVDTSIPQAKLDEAEVELRKALLAKARAEIDGINEVTNTNYRIQNVQFHRNRHAIGAQTARAKSAHGMILEAATMSYGSGASEDGSLGNAQKIVMSANITLAAFASV